MDRSMCRICLAENIRMYSIVNTDLQRVYEKLSEYALVTEARPVLACYICYARLKNCQKLMLKCCHSEKLLTLMACEMKNNLLNEQQYHGDTLRVTSVELMCLSEETNVVIKQEPLELVEIEVDMGIYTSNERSMGSPEDRLLNPEDHRPAATGNSREYNNPMVEENKDFKVKVKVEQIDAPDKPESSTDIQTNNVEPQTYPDDYIPLLKAYTQRTPAVSTPNGDGAHTVTNKTSAVESIEKSSNKVTSGTRPYKCYACPSSFHFPSALKNHIRIHTGEKPYRCSICQSTFRHLTHLNDHIRTHTGEKPYQCSMCTSAFRHQTHLNNHIRTHTGEKPYKCQICQSSFTQKGTLDSHILKHTGQKPQQCVLCETRFTNRSSLARHMRRKHKEHSPKIETGH